MKTTNKYLRGRRGKGVTNQQILEYRNPLAFRELVL